MKDTYRLGWDDYMQMLVLVSRHRSAHVSSHRRWWFWPETATEAIDALEASDFQKFALKRHAKRIIKSLRPVRRR